MVRRTRWLPAAIALLALLVVQCPAQAQQTPPPAPKTHLKAGDPAPDVELRDHSGKPFKLSDFKGKKNVVLAFYVLAFTGGWEKELKAYQADIAKFDAAGTQVVGISVDSSPANKHFAEHLGITYPLLSDFKRKAVKDYGIFNEDSNMARRATFVVDKKGIIQHVEEGKTAVDPSGAATVCARLPAG